MEYAAVRFTSKWPYNPSSYIVARFAGSKQFSHVMCVIDEVAYEATMLHGCRAVAVDEAMQGVVLYQDMTVPIKDKQASIAFGKGQVGKGYDFAGAFGIPFLLSEDWADWSKWWCSELTFMQIMVGGTTLIDPCEQYRVTPNDLHQCNFPKSPIIYTGKQ